LVDAWQQRDCAVPHIARVVDEAVTHLHLSVLHTTQSAKHNTQSNTCTRSEQLVKCGHGMPVGLEVVTSVRSVTSASSVTSVRSVTSMRNVTPAQHT
jgi:hypothetical protein